MDLECEDYACPAIFHERTSCILATCLLIVLVLVERYGTVSKPYMQRKTGKICSLPYCCIRVRKFRGERSSSLDSGYCKVKPCGFARSANWASLASLRTRTLALGSLGVMMKMVFVANRTYMRPVQGRYSKPGLLGSCHLSKLDEEQYQCSRHGN